MRVTSKLSGTFEEILDDQTSELSKVLRAGMDRASDIVQADLRSRTRAARLGNGLEKAWRKQLYPRSPKKTLHPAALVYSNATFLHRVFIEGAIIQAKNGRYLAIPTKEAELMGFARTDVSRKGGPIAAGQLRRASQVSKAIEELGEHNIRFIPLSQGRFLIVYDPKSGNIREKRARPKVARPHRGTRKRPRVKGIPLFFLIPQVRLRSRIDFDSVEQNADNVLATEISNALGG